MAKEARNILSQMCPDYIQLNQQVSTQHLISHFSVHGNACMPCSETSARFGQYSRGKRCDGVGLRIGRTGFESWPGTLCRVLSQNTLPSQCLSPPRCWNWHWSIVWATWRNAGVGLQWTSIPFRRKYMYEYSKQLHVTETGVGHRELWALWLGTRRSPLLGECNSRNKPMQWHFYRQVYY